MNRQTATPRLAVTKRDPRTGKDDSIIFVSDGQERHVNLHAPRPVRRKGRSMVSLIDLWVASLLPGSFLDLTFQIVASGAGGAVRANAPVDALLFARGFVAVTQHELWWDDPADAALNGFRLHSVVVRADVSPLPPSPPTRPEQTRAPIVANLARILPVAAFGYPAVQWRSAVG
jgi:hypothetical protein